MAVALPLQHSTQRKVGKPSYLRLRSHVLERDGHACVYCGSTLAATLVLDHIVPLNAGGTWSVENLVAACHDCNSSKRDLPVETWLLAFIGEAA